MDGSSVAMTPSLVINAGSSNMMSRTAVAQLVLGDRMNALAGGKADPER
jgi:hypothetical protein